MRAAVPARQPVLGTEAEFVRQTRRAGAEATLFVESAEGGRSSDSRHLSLSVLSEMGVSLECAYEDA